MSRLALAGEALACAATVALAVLAAVGAAPGHHLVGAIFAGAIAWSAVPPSAHLVARTVAGRRRRTDAPGNGRAVTDITTVIRLGQEPLDVARTTVLLAAEAGPTTVVGLDGGIDPALRHLGAVVIEAPSFGAGLASALHHIDTEGVLIVSARAVPLVDSCRAAAARLSDELGWVIGRVRPFTTDSYVHDTREPVTTAVRALARRAGAITWEADATIVRTDLLRQFPIDDHRPLGHWLRTRNAEGIGGTEVDLDLVRRAAPVDAAAYWPDAVSRQWGRVADLSGAATSGPLTGRIAAVGALARDLFAVPATVWLALPLLVGSGADLPYPRSATACLAIVSGLAMVRYLAFRLAIGHPPHPLRDAVSALHHLPGSWSSVGALITRRMPRRRLNLPSRPLVWAALALTIATGYQLVDSTGLQTSPFAIGLSLSALALLWMFSMGALAQRNWARSTYRIALALPVTVDGVHGRTVNGSPSGVAVAVAASHAVGLRVPVELTLDDGSSVGSTAEVVGRRHIGGTELLGLSLDFDDDDRRRWADQLSRSAEAPRPATATAAALTLDDIDDAPRSRRAADRIAIGLVAVVSVAIGSLLLLVMLGYRPLVIRSGSMVPTLSIGDVVLSEEVPVSGLRTGDIANLPTLASDGTGTLTHRIAGLTVDGDEVLVRTKGDANSSGETTRLAPDRLAGRVRWSIPWIGRPATAVRTSTGQGVIGLAALVIVVLGVVVRPRRRRPAA